MRSVFRLLQFLILGFMCCQISVADTNVRKEIKSLTEWWNSLFNSSKTIYKPSFSKQNQSTKTIYKVGIHPLHNPKRLFEVYAPLVDLFNAEIPEASFILESSRNYEEFEKKLYSGYLDIAMPNPYQTINAMKYDYHVFAKMGDDKNFRGLILVRVDSQIHRISDLKGKIVSYPAKTALAATLMPQYYLQTHGININTDIENIYVGSQESSIMNVLNRNVSAAATWPVPWNAFVQNNPQLAEQLNVKWETESLINNSWMARKNIPPQIIEKLNTVLINLSKTNEGQAILATIPISKFEAANDETYEPINAFVTKFTQTVRPLN